MRTPSTVVLAHTPPAVAASGTRVRSIDFIRGRVPFFFYLLHIPLIHALALVVSKIRMGVVSPWLFANHPMGNPPPPEGYVWSVPLLYLVWGVVILILYFPGRWFGGLKAKRQLPTSSHPTCA